MSDYEPSIAGLIGALFATAIALSGAIVNASGGNGSPLNWRTFFFLLLGFVIGFLLYKRIRMDTVYYYWCAVLSFIVYW